jgi:hypothetical protein
MVDMLVLPIVFERVARRTLEWISACLGAVRYHKVTSFWQESLTRHGAATKRIAVGPRG